MFKNLVIGIAATGLMGSVLPQMVCAQEASAAQTQERELAAAREQLELARRELEKAAREVAELSGRRAPVYVTSFGGPMRAELGIALEDGDDGVRVTGVTPGGPAAEAGVAVGDVITAIDSTLLPGAGSESQRLVEHMRNVDPGQKVVLQIVRNGAGREVTVTAREPEQGFAYWAAPNSNVFVRSVGSGRGAPNRVTIAPGSWGRHFEQFFVGRLNDLELVTLTPGLGSYFGATEGLLVVRAPDEPAMGLQEGDVILEIGGREPTSPEHAMRILMSFEPGETLNLAVMRRQRRETVEYVIPGG